MPITPEDGVTTWTKRLAPEVIAQRIDAATLDNVVFVLWEDTTGSSFWISREDLARLSRLTITTAAGVLVGRDAHVIRLAGLTNEEACSGVTVIPRSNIVYFTEFEWPEEITMLVEEHKAEHGKDS